MKPILFNTEMVRAILDRRKTVTRRICKDGNDFTTPDMSFFDASHRTYAVHNYADEKHTNKLSTAERPVPICPEDILYVRESWSPVFVHPKRYLYKADAERNMGEVAELPIKWHPSIHMPKEAARIFLCVKSVQVERLQDILKRKGAVAKEGIAYEDDGDVEASMLRFKELWDSTIKPAELPNYGWFANPWVWVIEFERCEKPEEEV